MSQSSISPTSREWPIRMRRAEASRYLRQVHGIRLSPQTLAKFATIGGGPRYRADGRFPLYDRTELDAWAERRLGPLRQSTSQRVRG